jgi:hypothetical protein
LLVAPAVGRRILGPSGPFAWRQSVGRIAQAKTYLFNLKSNLCVFRERLSRAHSALIVIDRRYKDHANCVPVWWYAVKSLNTNNILRNVPPACFSGRHPLMQIFCALVVRRADACWRFVQAGIG